MRWRRGTRTVAAEGASAQRRSRRQPARVPSGEAVAVEGEPAWRRSQRQEGGGGLLARRDGGGDVGSARCCVSLDYVFTFCNR